MSKKKARLIRTDNFYINQYYNLYNSKSVVSSIKLKSFSVNKEFKNSFELTNHKSLQYNAVYKKTASLSTKNFTKIESYSYPLYMTNWFNSESSLNYNNSYKIRNIKTSCKEYGLNYKTSDISMDLNSRYKFFMYKNTSSYFRDTYRHFIKHFFEHEDENKLIKRKGNLRKFQTFEINA